MTTRAHFTRGYEDVGVGSYSAAARLEFEVGARLWIEEVESMVVICLLFRVREGVPEEGEEVGFSTRSELFVSFPRHSLRLILIRTWGFRRDRKV
jgi:hypothetical protein